MWLRQEVQTMLWKITDKKRIFQYKQCIQRYKTSTMMLVFCILKKRNDDKKIKISEERTTKKARKNRKIVKCDKQKNNNIDFKITILYS